MNKTSKTIISVLALAALVAVGLVFYNERIVNKEKSILDTEGNPIEWIKYENKELGFSFEYPWNLDLELEDGGSALDRDLLDKSLIDESEIPLTSLFLDEHNEEEELIFSIDFMVYKNPKDLSAKEWWIEKGIKEEALKEDFSSVEIAGIEGLKSVYFYVKGEPRAWSIDLPKNKKMYSIGFLTKHLKKDQAVFDRFLDSVRIE